MADYSLPQQNVQQIGGTASSVAPNPLAGVGPGITAGAQLGFQARQIAAQEQEQRRLAMQFQQEMEMKKREQADKDFNAFGVSIKNLHALPPKLKGPYWDSIVVPHAQKIGLEVSPGYDPDIDDSIAADVKTIFEHHKKDPQAFTKDDVMGAIQLRALQAQSEGQEEQAKSLLDVAKQYKQEPGSIDLRRESMRNLKEERDQNQNMRIIDKFNADPLIRKHQQSIDFAGEIRNFASSGNPIAAAAIPTYMARASGEVGNLSESDKKPFGGSRAILARLDQSFKQMADGRLTPENQKFVTEMTYLMEKGAKTNIDKTAKVRSKQYNKAGMGDENSIYEMIRPDMGETSGSDEEYQKDMQEAALAIQKGLVTSEEAAKRIRQKYPDRSR